MRNAKAQPQPMIRSRNIHYQLSGHIAATSSEGMGAMHTVVQALGLVEQIDQQLQLLKVHLPYHQSDQVLKLAYNILKRRPAAAGH